MRGGAIFARFHVRMNNLRIILAAALILLSGGVLRAQTEVVPAAAGAVASGAAASAASAASAARPQTADYDVFIPIAKYLAQGNAEALSAWFADNLDMTVLSKGGNSSRSQARQILKSFFEGYTPRDFQITYTAGRANMKYALGTLNAGGENFLVTIFVSSKGDTYTIQQMKIERIK